MLGMHAGIDRNDGDLMVLIAPMTGSGQRGKSSSGGGLITTGPSSGGAYCSSPGGVRQQRILLHNLCDKRMRENAYRIKKINEPNNEIREKHEPYLNFDFHVGLPSISSVRAARAGLVLGGPVNWVITAPIDDSGTSDSDSSSPCSVPSAVVAGSSSWFASASNSLFFVSAPVGLVDVPKARSISQMFSHSIHAHLAEYRSMDMWN